MKKIPKFTEKDRSKAILTLLLSLLVISLISLIFYAPLGLLIPFVLGVVLFVIALKKQSREQYELLKIKECFSNEKNNIDS